MYKSFGKRLFDIILAAMGFIILLPLFVSLIALLCFFQRGNPFFFQSRPGLNGKIFKIVKFRTMSDLRDSDQNLLDDSIRTTAIGKFLRQTSIDELPQLYNVLTGTMSLVGPRPLLVEYLPLYNEKQRQRHKVKPGITGWAQVNGRNAITWQKKFDHDLYYAENVTFLFDLSILFKTIYSVFSFKSLDKSPENVSEKFIGE